MSEQTIVVVGAGQAGIEAAAEARRQGFTGRVVIYGEEPQPPYKRPPLSKAYLAGTATEESLYVMKPAVMEKHQIEFVGNARVTKIDRAAKTITLADGRSQSYDKLVLATGGRARALPMPGADASNVFVLRTIADIEAIKAHCQPGKRAVIIGGGFIGLEGAASMTKLGVHVTLLEGLPRVLARVTVPLMSEFFERAHREAGVDLRTNVKIAGFEGNPVTAITLEGGERIETDFVVVGIGLVANVELAQDAGLTVDNGIVVDQYCATSDPDIYAAGDCTNHPNVFLGGNVRLESVQNALEQGRAVGRNLAGKNEPYHMVPWFWSDQFDLKLQMVGVSAGHDQVVVRGNPQTERNFAVFYLKGGKMIAADAVSRPQDFMHAKKLVAEGAVIDPAKLADETLPLKTLTAAAA